MPRRPEATSARLATGSSFGAYRPSTGLQIVLGALAGLILGTWLFTPFARAQWRIRTPRDTVVVPANRIQPTQSKLHLASGIYVNLDILGTFGAFSSQNGGGFDGRYCYSVPGWNAPFPLANPPSWNGASYQVYFAINPTGLQEDSIHVNETSFQQSHHYSARYLSSGPPFEFRIINRLNLRPDGYYYAQGTGGLTVQIAQYTAGIALQSNMLAFGTVAIGLNKQLSDSIASYGIDPLQVDSVWIDGPQASQFSVQSQRGSQFTLPNEAGNGFRITYAPTMTGDVNAFLHIRSRNSDGPSRVKSVTLRGTGASAKVAIGPDLLDFGRVRTGYPSQLSFNIYNGGNAQLRLDSIWLVNDPGTPAGVFYSPTNIANVKYVDPLSNRPIPFLFNPPSEKSYRAVCYIQPHGFPLDSVVMIGSGAQPIFIVKDSLLEFGTVRSGDRAVRYDTVINIGHWTANIVKVELGGTDVSAFSYAPADSSFLLDPSGERDYVVTFHPVSRTDGGRNAWIRFSFDNASAAKTIFLHGTEERPRMVYDTNVVNFGKVKVWSKAYRTVGVANVGNTSIGLNTSWQTPDSWLTFDAKAPAAVSPGRDTLQLSFHPHLRGSVSNWLYLNASNGQRDSIYLTGIGAQPFAAFSPALVDFGVVPIGVSKTTSTKMTDTGDYPLYIKSMRITGPDAADFSVNGKAPDTVLDGGVDMRYIGLSFITSQRSGRTHYARLEVVYDDGSYDTVGLRATEAAQFIQFGSSKIDFGKVRVGTQTNQQANFTNGADVALTVGKIWAAPQGPFYEGQQTTTVDPRSTASIRVSFAPTATGTFTGYLHAKDGDIREDSIPLTGIGAQSMPQLSATNMDLGVTYIGVPTPAQKLTLTNAGNWPCAVKIFKTKDPMNEFKVFTSTGSVDPTAVDTAAESASRTYTVTFTPAAPQLPYHEADLLFQFDDGTSQTVTLIGHDSSDFLAVDSSEVNFGKVRIGTAPTVRLVHLINTSAQDLTANQLVVTPGGVPFSATPSGTVPVQHGTATEIRVAFQPTAMGTMQGLLVGSGNAFKDKQNDTVVLTGIGAQPVPQLSSTSLDFGLLTIGDPGTQSFSLANNGNWPLNYTWTIGGPNAADFSIAMPTQNTIAEGGSQSFVVNFAATTPLQSTPRMATVTFTEDDGTTFTLDLVAHDKAPLGTVIGFGNYIARPGDKFYAYLRLRTPIPNTMHIQHLTGTIHYDPTVLDLLEVVPASLLPAPAWTVSFPPATPGTVPYDIVSTTDTLTEPGALIRLQFEMRHGLPSNASSPLASTANYPSSREVVAVEDSGRALLDSSCSHTQMDAGVFTATWIDQSTPNPVSRTGTTYLPFDVSEDNTRISIRIMDPTGKEVLRPLDGVTYGPGHYLLPIEARELGASGVYFYEFRANDGRPTIMKLVVQ